MGNGANDVVNDSTGGNNTIALGNGIGDAVNLETNHDRITVGDGAGDVVTNAGGQDNAIGCACV